MKLSQIKFRAYLCNQHFMATQEGLLTDRTTAPYGR